jgi:hypothetical protein
VPLYKALYEHRDDIQSSEVTGGLLDADLGVEKAPFDVRAG